MTAANAKGTVLETTRLALRAWRDDDLPALHRDVLGAPEVMVYSLGVLSFEQAREWLQRKRRLHDENGFSHWAVIRKSDERLIGVCGIVYQDLPEGRFPEVGYRFARDVWGQGFATEAAGACLDWAWKNKNWGRLTAIIEPANRRSVRVAERIGMRAAWDTVYFQRDVTIYAADNPNGGPRGPF
jgi:RimJ/RimL family protein N-acetyltransferase